MSQAGLIKPRKYSIASAPTQAGEVSLVVGVVRYNTGPGRVKRGLATGMMETILLNSSIPGFISSPGDGNDFRLPQDPIWPIIMIAAGSGIAPFRGFWMKRFQQHQERHVVGKTVLYFGCRRKSMNLLKNETDLTKQPPGLLSKFFCRSNSINSSGPIDFERHDAFSQEPNLPKHYVQNILARDAEKVYDLWIRKGGYVYVCGKVKMAQGVESVIIDILKHIGNMNKDAAAESLEEMRRNKRYQEDIFG